jgi:AcrR family transcriptional regulator
MPRSVVPPFRFEPPTPPRTPKAERTRALLMGLAQRLFVERGYDAVGMRDIAAVAELTPGALYGHFRSKGQLLIEVLRVMIAETDALDTGSEIDIDRGVDMVFGSLRRDLRLLEIDAAAAARHDAEVAAGLAQLYAERHDSIRTSMAGLSDPDTAAFLVAAITAGIGAKEAAGASIPDEDRLHAALVAALTGLYLGEEAMRRAR